MALDKIKASLLLVEDEQEQRQLIQAILERDGYQVIAVASGEDALASMQGQNFDVVVSDWKLPGISGEDILEQVKTSYPQTGFILITAHSNASHAISMIRAGADDYLPKPFDKKSLLFTLEKLLHARHLEQENCELKAQSKHRNRLQDMIGSSAAMNRLFARIERAAPTTATILITGESGTGKELAARAIHQLSARKDSVFLPVNCAAIPESLAEAELFGAEKGAYTGSTKLRIGKIEAANGGTIFLDEIGELPLVLQSKLLRFLQEGCITRVGSNEEISLDVRVVTATNRDLEQEVKDKRFREDLFYRLNVIPVEIPPLRNRQDDIFPLIQHFLSFFSAKHGTDEKQVSQSALKALLAYSWPGNVRQLRNLVERLVLLSLNNTIQLADVEELELSGSKDAGEPLFTLPQDGVNWEAHEKDCLLQALSLCNNNRTQAAKLLGLNYKAFLYRMEKYSIQA